ncbi:MAG: hypothetical protein BGO76_01860 [Caedibacter sp. 38-128]|nr:MAG: hypothetical protein BGO76_01860 [Caedibacter sp. 38-128]
MLFEFSLTAYQKLCLSLMELKRPIIRFDELFSQKYDASSPYIILRHDVDRWPLNALEMAKLESDLGIRSTYYFRFIPSVFKKEIISKISEMGHEIGYHYETLSKAKGDPYKAIKIFKTELSELRSIAPIKTACMHGSPLSKFDNRIIWKHFNLQDYGILGEPYLSLNYNEIEYFTDTGRSWNETRTNLRDRTNQVKDKNSVSIQGIDDLITLFKKTDKPIILQTHPERWNQRTDRYLAYLLFDYMANGIKLALSFVR